MTGFGHPQEGSISWNVDEAKPYHPLICLRIDWVASSRDWPAA